MKGFIFHKILYRLSREQQRQFRGEENRYHALEALQSQVYGVLFGCSGGCGRKLAVQTYSVAGFEHEASHPLIVFCQHCGKHTEFREINAYTPENTQGTVEAGSTPKRYALQRRVQHILAKLRELSVEETLTADGVYYRQRVIALFDELKGVLDQLVSKQGRHLERLRAGLKRPLLPDRRRRYRTVAAFLFKNLPDFSGCEDEAGLAALTVKPIPSFFKTKNQCLTKQRYYLPRLTALSHQPMTGSIRQNSNYWPISGSVS